MYAYILYRMDPYKNVLKFQKVKSNLKSQALHKSTHSSNLFNFSYTQNNKNQRKKFKKESRPFHVSTVYISSKCTKIKKKMRIFIYRCTTIVLLMLATQFIYWAPAHHYVSRSTADKQFCSWMQKFNSKKIVKPKEKN